jgi:hypothetical protein
MDEQTSESKGLIDLEKLGARVLDNLTVEITRVCRVFGCA